MPLESNSDGFLVGKAIEISELTSVWRSSDEKLAHIQTAIEGIEKILMGQEKAGARAITAKAPVGRERADQPRTNDAGARRERSDTGSARSEAKETPRGVSRVVTPKSRAVGPREEVGAQRGERGDSAGRAGAQRTGVSAPIAFSAVASGKTTVDTASGRAVPIEGVALPRVRTRAQGEASAKAEGTVRDARGRFVGARSAADGSEVGAGGLSSDSAVSDAAGKIAEAVQNEAGELEEADPAVKAMSEIAQPMSRAVDLFGSLTGKDKSEESGWLRKILGTLTNIRKDSSVFQTIAGRRLKSIEKNGEEAAAEKSGGFLSSIFGGGGGAGGILGGIVPMLGAFAKRIPVIGGLFAGLSGLFGIFQSETDGSLTREEKDRRTGAAVGGMAGGIGGMMAGAKGGALLGAFMGPIGSMLGTIVGGAAGYFFGDKAGNIIGEMVGGWVADLRNADIPGRLDAIWTNLTTPVVNAWNRATSFVSQKWTEATESIKTTISGAWDAATASIVSSWEGVTGKISGVWEEIKSSILGVFEGITSWLSKTLESFGLDGAAETVRNLTESVGNAVDTAKEAASSTVGAAASYVSEKASAASSFVSEGFSSAKKSVTDFFGGLFGGDKEEKPAETTEPTKQKAPERLKPADHLKRQLGSVSEKYESGGRGDDTISTGRFDHGGASYGTYQLASKTGTLQKFLKSSGYEKEFEGLRPGSKAFNAKWKEVAGRDGDKFASAQHDFIKETHFDAATNALKARGIDLSGRGRAVQEALWSTSVQYGAGSEKSRNGAAGIFAHALAGTDLSELSDADIINRVQNYKFNRANDFFRSSPPQQRQAQRRRIAQERRELLALQDTIEPNAKEPKVYRPGSLDTLAGLTQLAEGTTQVTPPSAGAGKVEAAPAQVATVSGGGVAGGVATNVATGPSLAMPSPAIAAPKTPATASVTVTAMASPAPAMPAPAPASPIEVPMNSPAKRSTPVVRIEGDVGQDLQERRIAHIVTGGLA